jgi:flagellin
MLAKSLERLSSGYRVNRAADDAAGLAVSAALRADLASYRAGFRNAEQATAVLQTAEGAIEQISNMITRLKELSVQAVSANTSSADRTKIHAEASKITTEIDRIVEDTEYSGQTLLKGFATKTADAALTGAVGLYDVDVSGAEASDLYSVTSGGAGIVIMGRSGTTETLTLGHGYNEFDTFGVSFYIASGTTTASAASGLATLNFSVAGSDAAFQIGTDNDANSRITFQISAVQLTDLGLDSIDFDTSVATARDAMASIDTAVGLLASVRGGIGANQNRLSFAAANLITTIENTAAADAVIMEVDMAAEMTNFTKNQILMQAGTAMLAQANLAPQLVLQLLA